MIHEERFISVSGMQQWVTIHGDRSKPVLFMLHGGPGSPLSPYSNNIFGAWQREFIIVQWDQRGTGRTFGKVRPEELSPAYAKESPLELDTMVHDGIVLVKHLLHYLGKDKAILTGTSWGSVMGVRMVTAAPELFYAYLGHAQMVNPAEAGKLAFESIYNEARSKKDSTTLSTLNKIGKPPYDTARHLGQFMRIVKKYQQKKASPAPGNWFTLDPAYDNEKDNRDREEGDDYSFLFYAGDKKFGVRGIEPTINFLDGYTNFKVPVYLVQGELDLQTPPSITETYFNNIKTPIKRYYSVKDAEHGLNQSVLDLQFRILLKEIIPGIPKSK